MNIVTRSVAVVLTAAALGGLGAGVASAATPADTPTHAAVAQAVAGQQKLGGSISDFQVANGSTHYQLELLGTSDPSDANGTWDVTAPSGFVLTPRTAANDILLNTTGKTAVQGVLQFFVVDKNTGETGYFDATLAWLDNGSKLGEQVVKIGPSTWPGTHPVDAPAGVKINVGPNYLSIVDAG
ncbi:hypothetical protein [Pseudonocardia sp.]|jgi:hypothetical protein|uniref:hypothetical protein n=1 Tax=Pseudonocardia sp. TaxID=60912 RepID=UPI003D0F3818